MPQTKNSPDSRISLVYHAGGLGDFITTLPAVAEWNRRNPGRKTVLLGKPAYGILGVHAGLFDEVWDVENAAFSCLYDTGTLVPAWLQDKLKHVGSALIFSAKDSPVVARFREFRVKRLLTQNPFPSSRIHAVDYHLSLFAWGPESTPQTIPRISPDPGAKVEADGFLDGIGEFAVLHPGSGGERKNWPRKRFAELAEKIGSRGIRVVWITGPAERDAVTGAGETVIREAPLPVLVHVLSRCVFYVGNDSGISHLAAAVGAPVAVLFGPSDPAVWAPRGRNVTVVTAPRKACFPCHPSRGRGSRGCNETCLAAIPVEEVLAACLTAAGKH